MALCSVGENCVKEGVLRKFGVEVLEAVFVSSKPSLVVATAQAEEVLVVKLCMDVFGDFPVDVVAIVGEAESWGGVGVRDSCDGCEWERAGKEVVTDHCVRVGAEGGVVFGDVLGRGGSLPK